MFQTQPKYKTYVVQNAHTGEIHSSHPTRRQAQAVKDAAGDHALRVRGGKSIPRKRSLFLRRVLSRGGAR